jgi:hypothetical protein
VLVAIAVATAASGQELPRSLLSKPVPDESSTPATTDTLYRLLQPFPESHFEATIWNVRPHLITRRDPAQAASFLASIQAIEPLASHVASLGWFLNASNGLYDAYVKHSGAITLRNASGSVLPPMALGELRQRISAEHVSIVVKHEATGEPQSILSQSLTHQLLTDISVHAYLSPGGAQALQVSRWMHALSMSCTPSKLYPVAN